MITPRRHARFTPFTLQMRLQWRVLLCVAALLIVCGLAVAAPTDPVRVCRGGDLAFEGYQINAYCVPDDHAFGTIVDTTVSDLQADDMIGGYAGEYATMWTPGYLIAHPELGLEPYNPSDGTRYASFEALEWAGGGDDGGDDDGEEDVVVDFMQSGTAFAAAYMVCALFWGLGRGIGVLVDLVRR